MHFRTIAFAIAFPLLVALATPASAVTSFTATLTGANEAPANASTATGFATFVLNDAQTELSVSVTVFGLDFGPATGTSPQTASTFDDLVNAHIHCCAPPGTNASVRWGFIGTPFNNTTGINIVTPFASPGVGGTFQGVWDANEGQGTTLADQLPGILAGLSYINFHTTQFTGGEIRGQILKVPEPSTLIMMGLGLLGLRIARWIKKP
jgi:hypothetical protein